MNFNSINPSLLIESLVRQVENKRISREEAILQINEDLYLKAHKPHFDNYDPQMIIANGEIASKGAVAGKLVFTIEDCTSNERVTGENILFTQKITSDHLEKINFYGGIIAAQEDLSSHAIIIARGFGIPVITNVKNVSVKGEAIHINGEKLCIGDAISLDGYKGNIMRGTLAVLPPLPEHLLKTIYNWIDELLDIEVHANADTIDEAITAAAMGAMGIEPRTEHMLYSDDRLFKFRKMIVANSNKKRQILAYLKQAQEEDFIRLYEIMNELPVIIRLLDPPLHEFMPRDETTIGKIAKDLKMNNEVVSRRFSDLQETNPMMGHRGCRLLITNPEITQMQVSAIFNAAVHMISKGIKITPRIIIPMIIDGNEIRFIKQLIDRELKDIYLRKGIMINYKLGAMIETPRAAIMADTIAKEVDFVSYGTNDLTAQIFGFSRGDVYRKFLLQYLKKNIIKYDPFSRLDTAVKYLILSSVNKIRKTNPNIHIGICGEHGAVKSDVQFFVNAGFNCISVVPDMVPSVKLFAVQEKLIQKRKKIEI